MHTNLFRKIASFFSSKKPARFLEPQKQKVSEEKKELRKKETKKEKLTF